MFGDRSRNAMAIIKNTSEGIDGSETEWETDSEWEGTTEGIDSLEHEMIMAKSCDLLEEDMSRMSPMSMEYLDAVSMVSRSRNDTALVNGSSIYLFLWMYDIFIICVLSVLLLPSMRSATLACMVTFYTLPSRVDMSTRDDCKIYYAGHLVYSKSILAGSTDDDSSSETLLSTLSSPG